MGLNNALFTIILEYFDSYLPMMRKSSPKTISTYRKAIEQFLDYLKEQNDVRLYQVTITMINRQSVSNYLDYVETGENALLPHVTTGLIVSAHS